MTQKKAESLPPLTEEPEIKRSTRIENASPDLYDPNEPRVGRRESEPHSAEINYIYDVLTTNFPKSRTIWDLHHYFVGQKAPLKGNKIDIQFDISFFKDYIIPHSLSSYDASKHDGKIPDIAINILSKSTWRADLSENVDTCKNLGIRIYVIYSPFKVTSKVYYPPFMRVYILKDDGSYQQEELYGTTLKEGGQLDSEKIIDIGKNLPFRLGLMQLNQQHEGDRPLYRLIFIHPTELKLFSTKLEKAVQEKEKAVQEKEKAVQEKEKAVQEKEKAVQEKEKAVQEKDKAERVKEHVELKANQLENTLKKYQEKYGKLD